MSTIVITTIVATVIIVAVLIATALSIHKKLQEMKELHLGSQSDKLVGMLNQNISGMQDRLDKNTESLNSRLDNAAKVIGQVQHELGGMKEIGRSINDFQAFLKSPKIRGNLGETILYDALDQVFSKDNYSMQYKFKEGQVVDAALRTSSGIIPIDSKFPMEAFQHLAGANSDREQDVAKREFINSVRKHLRDISKKYILPQEGTVNFAVMYVPAEAVYYEVVQEHQEIYNYAQEQRIMIVSPNTLTHFLQVVLMGIERSKLHQQSQKVWEILKGVQKETEKFGERLSVLNRHITNAKNSMDSVSGEYTKLSGKVDQVKLLE
jgi:DNA recombination protein RmuC